VAVPGITAQPAPVPISPPAVIAAPSQVVQPPAENIESEFAWLTDEVGSKQSQQGLAIVEKQKEDALVKLNGALAFHYSRDDRKALKLIGEAVRLDPGIVENPDAVQLITLITRKSRAEASAVLRNVALAEEDRSDQSEIKEVDPAITGRRIRLLTGKQPRNDELAQTAIEMAAVFAVLFTIQVAIALLVQGEVRNVGNSFNPQWLNTIQPMLNAPLSFALGGASGGLLELVVFGVICYGIGLGFGGRGSFLRFIRFLTRGGLAVYIATTVLEFIGGVLIGASSAVNSVVPGGSVSPSTQAVLGAYGGLVIITLLLGCVSVVGLFALVSYTVSKAHNFGIWRGVSTVFVAGIVVLVIVYVLYASQLISSLRSMSSQGTPYNSGGGGYNSSQILR